MTIQSAQLFRCVLLKPMKKSSTMMVFDHTAVVLTRTVFDLLKTTTEFDSESELYLNLL